MRDAIAALCNQRKEGLTMATWPHEAPPDRHAKSSASTAPTRPPAAPSIASTSIARACCTRVMLRSPHAHARIKNIDTGPAEKIPGFRALPSARQAAARKSGLRGRGDRRPSAPTPKNTPRIACAPSASTTKSCRTSSRKPTPCGCRRTGTARRHGRSQYDRHRRRFRRPTSSTTSRFSNAGCSP